VCVVRFPPFLVRSKRFVWAIASRCVLRFDFLVQWSGVGLVLWQCFWRIVLLRCSFLSLKEGNDLDPAACVQRLLFCMCWLDPSLMQICLCAIVWFWLFLVSASKSFSFMFPHIQVVWWNICKIVRSLVDLILFNHGFTHVLLEFGHASALINPVLRTIGFSIAMWFWSS
jgi:hypothetical protein